MLAKLSADSRSMGEQTAWRERRRDEGIFFTSKMVDLFKITAHGKTWTVNNLREDQSVGITSDEADLPPGGHIGPADSQPRRSPSAGG